ncbi:hypothetical protein KC19_2G224000 [Ceratodon purpureus]|uniref:Uncharacterized protein n=1 Tax=Ceratodon purpureus TaxID=3225 RepID=A0A8T0IY74_CERPU|nr:hypothetical protein KC19_2G224000 [Ceratodon purpureus]
MEALSACHSLLHSAQKCVRNGRIWNSGSFQDTIDKAPPNGFSTQLHVYVGVFLPCSPLPEGRPSFLARVRQASGNYLHPQKTVSVVSVSFCFGCKLLFWMNICLGVSGVVT